MSGESNAEIVLVDAETTSLLDTVAEDVFDDDIVPSLLAAFVADPHHLMTIAIVDGVVVGQARGIVHLQPDGKNQLYIDNLGVAPGLQRRGIATRLMTAMITAGEAQGCEDVWLGTEVHNAQACGFYRSFGLKQSMMVMFANFDEDD